MVGRVFSPECRERCSDPSIFPCSAQLPLRHTPGRHHDAFSHAALAVLATLARVRSLASLANLSCVCGCEWCDRVSETGTGVISKPLFSSLSFPFLPPFRFCALRARLRRAVYFFISCTDAKPPPGAAAVSHRCNDRVPHLDRVPHFAKPPPTADLVWPPRAAREPKKTRSRAECPGISPTTVRARQRARCARYMKLRRCAIVRMWRHEQSRVNCVTRASQALFHFDYRIICRHSSAPRQLRALAESIPERS